MSPQETNILDERLRGITARVLMVFFGGFMTVEGTILKVYYDKERKDEIQDMRIEANKERINKLDQVIFPPFTTKKEVAIK